MCRHPSLIDAADLVRTDIGDDVDELLTEFLASDTVMIILIFEKVRQALLHERKAVIPPWPPALRSRPETSCSVANWIAPVSPRVAKLPRAADRAQNKNLLRDRYDPLRPRSSRSAIPRERRESQRYPAVLLLSPFAKRPCCSRSRTRKRQRLHTW